MRTLLLGLGLLLVMFCLLWIRASRNPFVDCKILAVWVERSDGTRLRIPFSVDELKELGEYLAESGAEYRTDPKGDWIEVSVDTDKGLIRCTFSHYNRSFSTGWSFGPYRRCWRPREHDPEFARKIAWNEEVVRKKMRWQEPTEWQD